MRRTQTDSVTVSFTMSHFPPLHLHIPAYTREDFSLMGFIVNIEEKSRIRSVCLILFLNLERVENIIHQWKQCCHLLPSSVPLPPFICSVDYNNSLFSSNSLKIRKRLSFSAIYYVKTLYSFFPILQFLFIFSTFYFDNTFMKKKAKQTQNFNAIL